MSPPICIEGLKTKSVNCSFVRSLFGNNLQFLFVVRKQKKSKQNEKHNLDAPDDTSPFGDYE